MIPTHRLGWSPNTADAEAFKRELYKAGVPTDLHEEALKSLPTLMRSGWSATDAAEALAVVLNSTGTRNVCGAALAATGVARLAELQEHQ